MSKSRSKIGSTSAVERPIELPAILVPASREIQKGLGEYAGDATQPAMLRCGCTEFLKKSWCQHLDVIMKHEYDGRDPAGKVTPLFSYVSVPVFRSPDLSIPVMVLAPNEQGFRKVGVILESEVDEDTTTLDLLGYVIDGQGRRSLRTLVMDWLNERGAHADYEQCTSPLHDGKVFKFTPSNGHLSGNPKRAVAVKTNFADLACLIIYKECYACLHSAGIPEV